MDGENLNPLREGKEFTPSEISSRLQTAADRLSPVRPEPQIGEKAFYGLAGIVRLIGADTEASMAGMLLVLLTAFGNACGRNCYYQVESVRHYSNLFIVLVGDTSKARKGTAVSTIREVMRQVNPEWEGHNIKSGLVSGEGLKYHVRDGRDNGDKPDPGVSDKRILVNEAEFASVLRAASRSGNTLSATLRDAWDTGNIFTLAKNDPITATGAHISITGQITVPELKWNLSQIDITNGYANRFLWCYVRRSHVLPFGGEIQYELIPYENLKEAIAFGQVEKRITMEEQAKGMWRKIYPVLSEGKPGLVGSITSRAEAQVIRLALTYALLDCSPEIRLPHLEAALAVWDYCEKSAQFIFKNKSGNKTADAIFNFLKTKPDGTSRTEINNLFHHNKSVEEIDVALDELSAVEKITITKSVTGGRNATIYMAGGDTN